MTGTTSLNARGMADAGEPPARGILIGQHRYVAATRARRYVSDDRERRMPPAIEKQTGLRPRSVNRRAKAARVTMDRIVQARLVPRTSARTSA